jgi:transcriptional pleiotropic regulator of transition state genes
MTRKEKDNMRSTGVVRKVDNLGRIVVPREIIKGFMFEERQPLEIYVEDDKIILKKFEVSCLMCGSKDNLFDIRGKKLCKDCISEINSI